MVSRFPYVERLLAEPGRTPFAEHLHLGYWPDGVAVSDAEALASAQERLVDLVVEALDLQRGQTVVDVGCGFGGTVRALERRALGLELLAINIDDAQLRVARELGPDAVEWLKADACALPLEDESVDRIVSIEAAQHFSSRRRFIEESARVLRPAGRLVMTDITSTDALRDSCEDPLIVRAAFEKSFGPWPDLFAPTDYADWAAACGLRLVERRDISAGTEPTYAWIADGDHNRGDEGMRHLSTWHRQGLLRYELLTLAAQ